MHANGEQDKEDQIKMLSAPTRRNHSLQVHPGMSLVQQLERKIFPDATDRTPSRQSNHQSCIDKNAKKVTEACLPFFQLHDNRCKNTRMFLQ
jgi:hypothetical protein